MRNRRGFTILEIMLAVLIAMLITMLAVPSIGGFMADQRTRRSFDALDGLVRSAVEHSVTEKQPYLIAWTKDAVILTTSARMEDENAGDAVVDSLPIAEGDEYTVTFPYALEKEPEYLWTFWPSGTCEAAVISYKGRNGSWTVRYNPLTVHATFEASDTGATTTKN
jgi:type II secretory pathway pseudopilin PulG